MFWQKGFCKRSKVRNTDVAFYLAKYLGKDEQTYNYQRTYSCSQGLKQPEEIEDMLVAYRLLLAYAHAHTKWSLSEEVTNPYTKSTTRYADIYPPPN